MSALQPRARSAPRPRAAWVLARLLCGQDYVSEQPIEGELESLAAPWNEITRHLQELPLAQRWHAWNGFLMAFANWDEIALAIDRSDPRGPAPEPSADDELPVVLRAASEIQPRVVQWLWRPRLPLGALALFAGDPKLGKSLVTTSLAAAVSRGADLPFDEGGGEPGSVILMSAEDDPARTIVPRLKAAGANLSQVHLLEAVKYTDHEGGSIEAFPHLDDVNRAYIEQAAARLGDTRLIIIDPISAYLGGVDDHRNAELRGLLTPLARMAERLGTAVVLVTHLNKAAGTNGKHRVSGSMGYVGVCRANFLFVHDRRDPTGRRVLMLDNGCNLAAAVPTLAYRIEDQGYGAVVRWETAPVAITTEEALQAETEPRQVQAEARECEQWLLQTLAEGPVEANEVKQAGLAAGFTSDQLIGAKERLGIKPHRAGFGDGGKWVWALAAEPATAPSMGPTP